MTRAFFLMLMLAGIMRAAKTMEIYFIDVEGGQSTLIVSPSGQSLLIDTGYAGFSGRDVERITTAAKAAHVKNIDYVLITHHHSDHEGGVPNLLERFKVGMFYEHGPSVDTSKDQERTYKTFLEAMKSQQHQVIKPGDTIPVKGIDVKVVVAGGQHIEGKGDANAFCSAPPPPEPDIPENAQSAGVVVQFGKFRFADFGDLTWDKEIALLCPENRVGKVDLYLTTHHGAESSKSVYALAPRVAIMNNGPRKGGTPAGWKVAKSTPGLEDLWQLHFAMEGGSQGNVPDPMIANVEERCEGKYLKVTAEADGSFTVYNSRNKYTKTYNKGL
jgi:competence protein ComEC